MDSENNAVQYTGLIPVCPHCKKPTRRSYSCSGGVTAAYYTPVYDENGNNTNPDRNTRTDFYNCHECNNEFGISGNVADGYIYKK